MKPVDYDLTFERRGNKSWCTFETYHFCSHCLFYKQKDQSQNLKRIGAFYLKPANFPVLNHFRVQIWFSFITSYCIRRNEELYKKKDLKLDCSHSFEVYCSPDHDTAGKSIASYFGLSYKHDFHGWCVDH